MGSIFGYGNDRNDKNDAQEKEVTVNNNNNQDWDSGIFIIPFSTDVT